MATFGFFVLGLVVLIIGAEVLVRGASRLAVGFGIPSLVVGLTVVAFGTSAPELAVTVQSSLAGQGDLAVGNVVGSNITNILLILGIAAIITPLTVDQKLVRWDVPLMVGISLIMWLMASDGVFVRWEGAVLFIGIIAYTIFAIVQSRHETARVAAEYEAELPRVESPTLISRLRDLALILVGLVLLVQGARWIVDSAVQFARELGISELVIGLTVIAVGTSLPEIAATVVASIRGERDIAVGNVVGSNIFNILSVLGLGALVAPNGLSVSATAIAFDIPVMIAVAVACLPIFLHGYTIYRWEGAIFLGYYIAYTLYLVLNAMQHSLLPTFNIAMIWFIIPLTLMTFVIILIRVVRQGVPSQLM
ncbi:MAG: calcium/sodium antiporter [Roseiflexaceae bacterium]